MEMWQYTFQVKAVDTVEIDISAVVCCIQITEMSFEHPAEFLRQATTDVQRAERLLLCILSHWSFSTGKEAKRVQTSHTHSSVSMEHFLNYTEMSLQISLQHKHSR